jgi:hypothetical protein
VNDQLPDAPLAAFRDVVQPHSGVAKIRAPFPLTIFYFGREVDRFTFTFHDVGDVFVLYSGVPAEVT